MTIKSPIGYKETLRLMGISEEKANVQFRKSGFNNNLYAVIDYTLEEDLKSFVARNPQVTAHPVCQLELYMLKGDYIHNEFGYVLDADEYVSEIAVELNDEELFLAEMTVEPDQRYRVFVGNVGVQIVSANIFNIGSEIEKLIKDMDCNRIVSFDKLITGDNGWDAFNGTTYYLMNNGARGGRRIINPTTECLYLEYHPHPDSNKYAEHIIGNLTLASVEFVEDRTFIVQGGAHNKIEIQLTGSQLHTIECVVGQIERRRFTSISLDDFNKRSGV